jgi:predicted transcriptional regulator
MENNMYTKKERLDIVLDIINKLKNFKLKDDSIIDIYNSNYSFINEFKIITNNYIKDGLQIKGVLEFDEIGKKIEYIFPQKNYKKPLFVIRMK